MKQINNDSNINTGNKRLKGKYLISEILGTSMPSRTKFPRENERRGENWTWVEFADPKEKHQLPGTAECSGFERADGKRCKILWGKRFDELKLSEIEKKFHEKITQNEMQKECLWTFPITDEISKDRNKTSQSIPDCIHTRICVNPGPPNLPTWNAKSQFHRLN